MRVYLLGIAGTGMGSFAGLLRKAGHEVSGSDENVYPPMSDKLAEWKIRVFTPYSADNLKGRRSIWRWSVTCCGRTTSRRRRSGGSAFRT